VDPNAGLMVRRRLRISRYRVMYDITAETASV
jgi:mRNA-degrading endonuclease RelE of RelBE toxin-antitoxin system